MNRINVITAVFLFAFAISFSQTAEPGGAFNRFMSPQSGINLLSGTVTFSKPLAQISSGGVSTSLDLTYSGNVFREVQSRNDRSPGSWVGLGWALGRAMILCDHRGTTTDKDDSYSLILPTGVRYQFIRDTINNKWWIEQQPYWQVERLTKQNTVYGKSYTVVVGWKIVNESGLVSYYGDYNETPNLLAPKRNATQYDLSWPYPYGFVGYAIGGNTALHPSAWNLSRQEDLEGNWIEYDYKQISEQISINLSQKWTSGYGYTREIYLDSIRTSTGSSIKLILEDKGQGDFYGEYWDSHKNPNAFINHLERKFLSAIEIFGTDGKKIGRIDLCYKALKIRINGKEAEGYTKRLLVSVIHTDAGGIETDREDYDYYTDAERASKATEDGAMYEPLGALHTIHGSNCGIVKYVYSYFSLSKTESSGIESHAQTIIDIGSEQLQMGYLSDGTRYMVGISDNGNVKIYGLFGGLWVNMLMSKSFTVSNAKEANILIGDKGWFAISDNGDVTPVVWNSEKWVVGSTITDNDSHENVWAGPDYIVHTRTASEKITLKILWSRWGGEYSYKIPDVDDDEENRDRVEVSAGRNHILVTYIKNDVSKPNSKAFMILTFSGDTLKETMSSDDKDNDNQYYLSGDYFYGLEESRGIVGYNSSAWHWNGTNWTRLLNQELHGWQGNLSLQAYGADYYAIRHNDNDDLTLFDFNGEKWESKYKNKNMVDNDDFDLFVESQWHGVNGNDFFIAKHPRNIWKTQRVCLMAVPKLWGLRCVFHVDIPYWQSTYQDARVTRFEKRDGVWSSTGSSLLGCPEAEKSVLAGQDWYTENACANKAWIWNSSNWHEENIDHEALNKIKSIGGEFFYKTLNNNTQIKIYRKLDDSFIKPFGAFVVTEKHVSDPVVDKSHVYAYEYTFAANPNDGSYAFDGPNNTPLADKVTIRLPENAGSLHQTMCSPRDDNRAGMGQVCEEKNLNAKGEIIGKTKYFYNRFRKPNNWPTEIYLDRLDSVKGISGGMRVENKVSYNDTLNGLPFKVVEISGNKERESRTVYAAEHYNALKNANRLSEVAASYTCIPSCNANGKISQASAIRYGIVSGTTIPYAFESWNWEPATVQAGNTFSFNWNSSTQNNVWKKVSTVTDFDRGRSVENVDRLGIYSAIFNESDSIALAYAKVANSKRNAVLLIPGESCAVSGLTNCNLIKLNGNATDSSGLEYGRFSATALQSPITANLAASIGGSYRFSAWVQGVDKIDRVLQLSFNGNTVKTWTIAGSSAGSWQRIQWEGNLSVDSVNVVLSAQGSSVRVQDIRLQPYEALSSVTFWNRSRGIPLVQVDERGIGNYVQLDAAGRVKSRYMEDESGRVFLSQQLNYASANCKDNLQGAGLLSALKVNGISLPLSEDELTYVLPDGEREFSVKWTLKQKTDKIRYQLYQEGQGANATWISACCGEIEAASGDATVQNWVLRLDVEPFNSDGRADYTINIRKDATGWTDHGGLPSAGIGSSGRYAGNHESNRLVFIDDEASGILKEATYNGNIWQTTAISNVRPEEFHITGKGNSRYITQFPINTGGQDTTDNTYTINGSFLGNTGNTWSNYGAFSEDSDIDLLRTVIDGQNCPLVLYRKAKIRRHPDSLQHQSDPGSLQVVRHTAQNMWEKVGSLPVFTSTDSAPSGFLPGRVSERLPADADIVLGSDGNIYIAYIGSIIFKYPSDFVGDKVNNDSAALRVVVVKRLYNAQESLVGREIWAGPSLLKEQNTQISIPTYDGDILTLDNDILIGARRVRIANDGGNIYLAVAHTALDSTKDGMLAVTVFKGTRQNNLTIDSITYSSKLVFEPLADTSTRGSEVFYLKSSESFDFVVRNGTPYIAFANEANRQKLTVIYHNGSRWLSVGNPAFASIDQDIGQLNLSVDSLKKPYVVYKESSNSKNIKRRNRVVPMKYAATGDRDLTLNAVNVSGASTSLSSDFRQYILNYGASFDALVTSLRLSPSPRTISDIVGISVERNDTLVGNWVISPNSSEAELYMPVSIANYSGTVIPTFTLPLSEGLNVVKVKVFGKNGKQLIYAFDLSREFLPIPNFGFSGIKYNYNYGFGTVSNPDSGGYKIIPNGKEPLCIWFSAGWFLKCGNDFYYSNVCFENNLNYTLECELGNGKVNEGGNSTIPIIIKPDDDEDSGGGGGSSSSGGGSSSSSSSSSSVGIPSVFIPWSSYSLFAGTNLNFADRVIVERGSVAAGNSIEVGVESEVRSAELISGGDVQLRNRASVQKIILSGQLSTQYEATYTDLELRDVNLPTLPVITVNAGTTSVTAGNDQWISLAPGSYGDFHAYSRSIVSFAPGDYYFSSFILEPDVKLEFGRAGVRIWVQGEFSLADRVVLENLGRPNRLMFYTNSNGHIRLGTSNALRAIMIAPMATVEIPSRVTYTSSIWAKNIIVQPDVLFPQ